MSVKKDRRYIGAIMGAAALVLVSGCGSKQNTTPIMGENGSYEEEGSNTDTGKSSKKITLPYNITIKAVVMKLDTVAGIVRLRNTSGGLEYTLTYNSATAVWDKYGNSKLMEEVHEGDVVEACIEDTDGVLAGICYNSENWEFEGSENWSFNSEKAELIIGKEKYYFSDDMVILSDGEEADIMDLNKSDILNIQGCGKKVLAVTVERGHGYVKLEGIEDFVGGWVEIGKVIKPISEDMLIVVPEGNWDVVVVKDGYGGSIGTTVVRNEEATVDFTQVASEIVRYGVVEFTIEPEDAILYIAGREMDYSNQIMLEYDTYKIRVSADGYEDYTGDLKVEKALVSKSIALEKVSSEQPSASATASPTASPTLTPTAGSTTIVVTEEPTQSPSSEESDDYVITIKSPDGVNVYFDDAFVGVSPLSFDKVSGEHTLTFSKTGYVTKSYSVEIGTDDKDVTFELPDLEKEE